MIVPGTGPRSSAFPATHHSLIVRLGSAQPEVCRSAFDALVTAYWKPVFKYLRLKWRAQPEEAADLTQAFFLRVYEKRYLDRFDCARARFRTYLRTCLDRFVSNARQHGSRLKRGGGVAFVPLDFSHAEDELQQMEYRTDDAEALFHREWIRELLGLALERFRQRCSSNEWQTRFAVFERYDLEDDESVRPTYASLARALNITVADVTNELAAARREFRRVVVDVLREQCASEEEFQAEMRGLTSV